MEAEGFSGGLWVFSHKGRIDVNIIKDHSQYIHIRVSRNDGPCWLLTIVYATLDEDLRTDFLEEMEELAKEVQDLWLIFGDFNSIETTSCSNYTTHRCRQFLKWIYNINLINLGFIGPIFT